MALFALAEKVGHPDPDVMGATIPAFKLREWMVYWGWKAKKIRDEMPRKE